MAGMPTPLCRLVMLEVERWRVALGVPMDRFSEYAGIAERGFSKYLHADTPSGRWPQWATVQTMLDALMPGGFDVTIRPRAGVMTADNLKGKLLQLKAQSNPKTQRALMCELGKKGGKRSGETRRQQAAERAKRKAAASHAARMRWHTPQIVEITRDRGRNGRAR